MGAANVFSLLVGETGQVVPPRDPQALVEGWKKILSLSEANARALGQAARARIVQKFSRERLVARTKVNPSQRLRLCPGRSVFRDDLQAESRMPPGKDLERTDENQRCRTDG